jgi:hypothetical protein
MSSSHASERRRRGVLALVAIAGATAAAPAARASKWTGPTMVVVEAERFRRVDCPAEGQVPAAGAETMRWLLPRDRVCLAARWTRVVEARNAWPPAMTDAFMQRLGRRIYTAGDRVPPGRAEVLLEPMPAYEGKAVSGASIRTRLVTAGDAVFRLDASGLARVAPTDGPYRDTFRVDLGWSRWQIGNLAAGEREAVVVTLILKQSCLPAPVDLARCAVYANLARSAAGAPPFQTLRVSGTLALDPAASIAFLAFLGTIDLDARPDPDVANGAGRYRIHARITPGDIEILP